MVPSTSKKSSKSFDLPFFIMFLPLIVFSVNFDLPPLAMLLPLSLFSTSLFAMSFSIFQYFNYSKNPTLTMPLCLVFYSNMFSRSYNSSNSGPKLPLAKTWLESPKSNVNPIGTTKSLELQNPKSSFAIFEVLPKIPYVINVDPNEVFLEILNSIAIDLGEIWSYEIPNLIPKLIP